LQTYLIKKLDFSHNVSLNKDFYLKLGDLMEAMSFNLEELNLAQN